MLGLLLAELILPTLFAIELTPLLADAFVLISIESIDDLLLFRELLGVVWPLLFSIATLSIATADATTLFATLFGVLEPEENESSSDVPPVLAAVPLLLVVVVFELVFDS